MPKRSLEVRYSSVNRLRWQSKSSATGKRSERYTCPIPFENLYFSLSLSPFVLLCSLFPARPKLLRLTLIGVNVQRVGRNVFLRSRGLQPVVVCDRQGIRLNDLFNRLDGLLGSLCSRIKRLSVCLTLDLSVRILRLASRVPRRNRSLRAMLVPHQALAPVRQRHTLHGRQERLGFRLDRLGQ